MAAKAEETGMDRAVKTQDVKEDRIQTTYGNSMGIAQKARLKKAFELFDVNKDGKISAEELTRLLCKMGNQDTRSISVADAQELINDFDDNVSNHAASNAMTSLFVSYYESINLCDACIGAGRRIS